MYGDRNTKYFHAKTVVHKRRSNIVRLKDDQGEWVEDGKKLQRMAIDSYKNLFLKDHFQFIGFPIHKSFPELGLAVTAEIERPVSSEEIKMAAFSINLMKASRSDGLHALLFQSQWEHVGNSVCELVYDIFENLWKVKEINDSSLVLIPKVENLDHLKQFRPISLCNVVYKIVSKIIVNRIKPFLNHLISLNHCSLVLGRHNSDNIIVA